MEKRREIIMKEKGKERNSKHAKKEGKTSHKPINFER